MRITRELRDALQSVRRQLGRAKKQPAWRFAEKAGAPVPVEARRRRQLEKALGESRHELARATSILDDLARRAAKPTKARNGKTAKPRPTPWDDQMEFF